MTDDQWAHMTVPQWVLYHVEFMERYDWPDDKQSNVIRATLEGK